MTHSQEIRVLQDAALDAYVEGRVTTATLVLNDALTTTEDRLREAESLLTVMEGERDAARQNVAVLVDRQEGYVDQVADLENTVRALRAEVERLKGNTGGGAVPVVRPDNGYPNVHIRDIRQGNEDIDVTLARGVSYAPLINVELDPTLYELSDFKYARSQSARQAYGVLALRVAGLFCEEGEAVIQIRPNTSTIGHYVPSQSGGGTNQVTLMRLAGKVALKVYNIVLSGTDQGHLYNGWNLYEARGGKLQDCIITGTAGDMNYPPGETFIINDYRTENFTLERVETDGYQYVYKISMDGVTRVRGERKGGSPYGSNAAINPRQIDCNFHDSLVSGVTASFTGDLLTGTMANGWITEDITTSKNANHLGNISGKTFCGINMEGVMGKVRHYRPHIDMVNTTQQSPHIAIGNAQADNPDIEIHDATWTTAPNWSDGCLGIQVSQWYATFPDGSKRTNKQTSIPKVFAGGVQLQAVLWKDTEPRPTGLDPKKQFVVKRT